MAEKSEKQSAQEAVEEFCTQLRRRQISGSLPCAKRTAEIMRVLVTMQRHVDAASLIDDVRSVGYKIQAAKPVGEMRLLEGVMLGRWCCERAWVHRTAGCSKAAFLLPALRCRACHRQHRASCAPHHP